MTSKTKPFDDELEFLEDRGPGAIWTRKEYHTWMHDRLVKLLKRPATDGKATDGRRQWTDKIGFGELHLLAFWAAHHNISGPALWELGGIAHIRVVEHQKEQKVGLGRKVAQLRQWRLTVERPLVPQQDGEIASFHMYPFENYGYAPDDDAITRLHRCEAERRVALLFCLLVPCDLDARIRYKKAEILRCLLYLLKGPVLPMEVLSLPKYGRVHLSAVESRLLELIVAWSHEDAKLVDPTMAQLAAHALPHTRCWQRHVGTVAGFYRERERRLRRFKRKVDVPVDNIFSLPPDNVDPAWVAELQFDHDQACSYVLADHSLLSGNGSSMLAGALSARTVFSDIQAVTDALVRIMESSECREQGALRWAMGLVVSAARVLRQVRLQETCGHTKDVLQLLKSDDTRAVLVYLYDELLELQAWIVGKMLRWYNWELSHFLTANDT